MFSKVSLSKEYMTKKLSNEKRGFTMVELIITIFVITTGLLAVYSVSSQIIAYTNLSVSQLTAAYLAQEGIEIVRNIRDTNWITLGPSLWNTGLAAGDYEVDYSAASLTPCAAPCNYDSNLRFLNIDGGFYKYSSSGEKSKFKRKITITSSGLDILKVSVSVQWQDKGKTYTITPQENLRNWYKP